MKSNNQLIIFNPYYQKDVIEWHLKVLLQNTQVTFVKMKIIKKDFHWYDKT